jgi:hypothetical protein
MALFRQPPSHCAFTSIIIFAICSTSPSRGLGPARPFGICHGFLPSKKCVKLANANLSFGKGLLCGKPLALGPFSILCRPAGALCAWGVSSSEMSPPRGYRGGASYSPFATRHSPLASIAIPCSVKTRGAFTLPPLLLDEVAICDFNSCHSSKDN